jgi:hypothetical protein
MCDTERENLIYALAEVVKDVEVMEAIESKSGKVESSAELKMLEDKIMQKVIAYRSHDLWPPKIEPITNVMKFNS